MRIYLSMMLFLIALLYLLPQQSWSYSYRDPSADQLSTLLHTSLAGLKQERNFSGALRAVSDVNQKFTQLDRAAISTDELVQLKFEMRDWRRSVANRLLKNIFEVSELSELSLAIHALGLLGLEVSAENLQKILNRARNLGGVGPELVNLVNSQWVSGCSSASTAPASKGMQGKLSQIRAALQAGPCQNLDIHPIKSSDWGPVGWTQLKGLSQYDFQQDGLHFRGLILQPGDILIVELNENAGGFYSAFTTPRSYLPHFAFYATLQRDGNDFPAAIEIHEKGIRAVPLNVFLSPRFTSYVEVYRLRNKPESLESKIRTSIENIVTEPHGYNFYPHLRSSKYLTCATVGEFLLERMWVSNPFPRSQNSNLIHFLI